MHTSSDAIGVEERMCPLSSRSLSFLSLFSLFCLSGFHHLCLVTQRNRPKSTQSGPLEMVRGILFILEGRGNAQKVV